MKVGPLVSIVLPSYNGEKYIRQSIESILAQSYENWELIIVDDCSTDDTPKIGREYCRKDSRIKYMRNKTNLKLPASLNAGFDAATGAYLTWTSDDNAFKPCAIEIMLSELEKNDNLGLVYCDYDFIDQDGRYISSSTSIKSPLFISCYNVVGACFMYPAHIRDEIGPYATDLFLVEDYDYWLRIARNNKIKHLPENLYLYRTHPGSLTSTRQHDIRERACVILLRELKLTSKIAKKLAFGIGLTYNKRKLRK